MKTILGFLFISCFLSFSSQAAETISGPPKVLNSTTMLVNGKTIVLDYIFSLKPNSPCLWKGRNLDCGVLATAGLKDLVAGANVICKQNSTRKFTCTAAGYDLAYGLIHAGWAVPGTQAPNHYFAKQARTKQRKLGFWGATNSSGTLIAKQISAR